MTVFALIHRYYLFLKHIYILDRVNPLLLKLMFPAITRNFLSKPTYKCM